MTAVAGNLTVLVAENPEPMLIIGCRPSFYQKLTEKLLEQIKRDVAQPLGVSESNFVELNFHFDTTAKYVQLLGLPFREYAHHAHKTSCEIIGEVREALGLPDLRLDPLVAIPASPNGKHRDRRQTYVMPVPAYH